MAMQQQTTQERLTGKRSHTRRVAAFASAALLMLALGLATACSSSSDSSTQPGPDMLTTTNLQGKWSRSEPDPAPAGPSNPLQVEFTSGKQFGFYGGCNHFGGEYAVTDGKVVVSEMGSTTMACGDPGWILTDPMTFVLSGNGTVLTVGTTVGDQRLQRVDSFTD